MLVGEQPGDVEDRAGEPFVGPAGRLLREVLGDVGLDPDSLYLTNAVKHFRFEERGKRRLHKTPGAAHVTACHPWLARELELVSPNLVVVLGATAARSLLGAKFRVTEQRGHVLPPTSEMPASVLATVHPSAVLRATDRPAARDAFTADLQVAADYLATA